VLTFTSETLRAAYNYLNETPPFNKWNLPDGDDVEFQVVCDPTLFGWHKFNGKRHSIGISTSCVCHTGTLIQKMAHEMVHAHERRSISCGAIGHSKAFKRWAAQVCKLHGFDPGAF
jgi:hypothetical protein